MAIYPKPVDGNLSAINIYSGETKSWKLKKYEKQINKIYPREWMEIYLQAIFMARKLNHRSE